MFWAGNVIARWRASFIDISMENSLNSMGKILSKMTTLRSAGNPFLRQSFDRSRSSFVYACSLCQKQRISARRFATTARRKSDGNEQRKGPFRGRLRAALQKTRVEWKPIPVGLGIIFLGGIQFYRVWQREKRKREQEDENALKDEDEDERGRPKKRKRIRPSGPW